MIYNNLPIAIANNQQELTPHGNTEFPFAVYSSTHKNLDVPWHWHEEYEFAVMEKGTIPISAGGETFLLQEGDGIFINSGVLHAQPNSQGSKNLKKAEFLFRGKFIYGTTDSIFWQKYIRPITVSHSLPCIHFTSEISWQKEIIQHLLCAADIYQAAVSGYEFRLRNLFSEIFLLMYDNQNELLPQNLNSSIQEMEHVKKMLQYIRKNYAENITLTELAFCANICEREALRAFQNVICQSPIQYLIHYRIGKACELLGTGNRNITEIGEICGFSSPSYFSKTFKKIVGCQPKEYQKMAISDMYIAVP